MDDTTQPQLEPEVAVETIEKEKYLRLAADFENFRRQQSQLSADMAKFASQSVIAEMLELADMVDAAVAHAPPDVQKHVAWFGGLERVGKRFHEDMKKYGVKRIETSGKQFDPATMEAVQTVPGGVSQQVESEIRSGYMMHERVLRPARVIIYASE